MSVNIKSKSVDFNTASFDTIVCLVISIMCLLISMSIDINSIGLFFYINYMSVNTNNNMSFDINRMLALKHLLISIPFLLIGSTLIVEIMQCVKNNVTLNIL